MNSGIVAKAGSGKPDVLTKEKVTTMKALVYHGSGTQAWEDKPKPRIKEATDAIVRITTSTICGTDLHIMKGDVPTVTDGRRSRGLPLASGSSDTRVWA